ncbi:MAG: FecR family protein [Saprospiraceae bacterium]|jgi:ferric-dicitrate binding protein FerR (iron transport regulator)|nr:FecR family protein [Saprospiraceae bacterium]MBK7796402.1 FecR family protein [Saprospiraceae bacterium]MBK8152900.1 FecR family protein [Saprospiraceae bacterium]
MKESYSSYQVEQFLEDPDFVSWVMSGQPYSKKWSDFSIQYPEANFNYISAIRLCKALQYKSLEASSPDHKDILWDKIQSAIAVEPERKKIHLSRIMTWIGSAAASLLLVYFLFFFNKTNLIDVTTEVAQTSTHLLPDGSSVKLNAKSQVNYDAASFLKNRRIQLIGEAFFEVTKGSKFTVETSQGEVEVLGTSFNIYSRSDWMEVTCFTGKVAVTYKNNNSRFILTPGQKVNNKDISAAVQKTEIDNAKLWTSGYFYYNQVPLQHILDELQRQYQISDVQIADSLRQIPYTGYFHKANLQQAIHSICLPLRLEGHMEGNTLMLKKLQ